MAALNRQQWLAKFIELADKGAPAVDYRRILGIGMGGLHRHVAALDSYRKELAELNEQAKREALKNLARGKSGKEEAKG
jgi:hypothetical protein